VTVHYSLTLMVLAKVGKVEISAAEYHALGKAVEGLLNILDLEEKFAALVDNYFELEEDLLSEALGALVFLTFE
jgi:hypothetical protein